MATRMRVEMMRAFSGKSNIWGDGGESVRKKALGTLLASKVSTECGTDGVRGEKVSGLKVEVRVMEFCVWLLFRKENVVETYNSFLFEHAEQGSVDKVRSVLREMRGRGILPDATSYAVSKPNESLFFIFLPSSSLSMDGDFFLRDQALIKANSMGGSVVGSILAFDEMQSMEIVGTETVHSALLETFIYNGTCMKTVLSVIDATTGVATGVSKSIRVLQRYAVMKSAAIVGDIGKALEMAQALRR